MLPGIPAAAGCREPGPGLWWGGLHATLRGDAPSEVAAEDGVLQALRALSLGLADPHGTPCGLSA